MVDDRLAMPVTSDANDFIYQWEPRTITIHPPDLERIEATLLAINAADDERNPPETGVDRCSVETRKERPALSDPGQHRDPRSSHHRHAAFYKRQLQELLQTAPQRRCETDGPEEATISHRIDWRRASLIILSVHRHDRARA